MQVSHTPLNQVQEGQLYQQLRTALAKITDESAMSHVINDFFTEMEQQVFIKRLAIAVGLHEGHSYQEIRKDLQVSTATISFVAERLQTEGFQMMLEKVSADRWAKKVLGGMFAEAK